MFYEQLWHEGHGLGRTGCSVPSRSLIYITNRLTAINPLTAGVAYMRVFIFYQHITYHFLNMLKIKYDINQQYLKTADLHFVKSE